MKSRLRRPDATLLSWICAVLHPVKATRSRSKNARRLRRSLILIQFRSGCRPGLQSLLGEQVGKNRHGSGAERKLARVHRREIVVVAVMVVEVPLRIRQVAEERGT